LIAHIESPPLPTIRSDRAAQVAELFGITPLLPGRARPARGAFGGLDLRRLIPRGGQIVLLTGASGAGKSSLLDALRREARPRLRWIDLASIRLPDSPVIDCLNRVSLQQALAILSRVGLAEAWTYLRKPAELSEGQRWRLRLAKALMLAMQSSGRSTRRPMIVCDEFAATLDRITAAIISRCLRRAIDASHGSPRAPCAIVATSHDDLSDALAPDVIVRCDFSSLQITRR
jgi:ABC-type ATPase with predicted acetyltransferase domain